jgi:glycosyltransferase involved in cell wall biosynthesis
MTAQHRPCLLIPTFDNPSTIRRVVEAGHAYVHDIVVVDDGSGPAARREIDALAAEGLAHVVRRAHRGGKGAAVKDGLREAHRLGFTHAVQVDADDQHTITDVPILLAASRQDPDALLLGTPHFDETAPRVRIAGRRFNMFWTNLELGKGVVLDSLCGFRVYPIARALEADAKGNAMDFDPEIPVRMAWRGTRIVNVPTHVRYFPESSGHVSHFRMVRDNALIVRMHVGLLAELLFKRFGRRHATP